MKINNPKILEDIKNGTPLKLDLGCGTFGKEKYYTVDWVDMEGVDIVADLNKPLYLIPDNSVSCIYSRHTLEHIQEILLLMNEIYRISIPKATVEIIVPHASNVLGYSDPTHLRLFGLYSMCYFVREQNQKQKRKVPSHYSKAFFVINKIRIRFYNHTFLDRIFGPLFYFFTNFNMAFQEFYERRLSCFFHAWEISYQMQVDK